MSIESTKLESDKPSVLMIWTNFVRLVMYGVGMYRNQTREEIDNKLIAAGCVIQDKKKINLYEKLGVAVREMDVFINFTTTKVVGQNSKVPLGCTDHGAVECLPLFQFHQPRRVQK